MKKNKPASLAIPAVLIPFTMMTQFCLSAKRPIGTLCGAEGFISERPQNCRALELVELGAGGHGAGSLEQSWNNPVGKLAVRGFVGFQVVDSWICRFALECVLPSG
jgi:hypothetical protein